MSKNNTDAAVLDPSVAEKPVADAISPKAAKAIGGGLMSVLSDNSEAVQRRQTLRQTIRQHLAEVVDLGRTAAEGSSELTAKAASVAFELYQARVSGDLSPGEVSDILGDIFGVKGTGKNIGRVMRPGEKGAGKTPAGTGEEIRKRVVRAHAAWDFARNGLSPSTKYFEGFEQSEVQTMVDNLAATSDDGTTLWSFYKDIGDAKREMNDTTPFHLNPERVAKLAGTLSENIKTIANAINGNSELKAAYAGLFQQFLIINELVD